MGTGTRLTQSCECGLHRGDYVGWSEWRISPTGAWDPTADRMLSLVLAETQWTIQSHNWWSREYADAALRPFLFGFRGAVLTTGAVAGNCTRCDAASIETRLETLANP